MMDDVRQKFLPRFASLARERIARAKELAQERPKGEEALSLAREFHSLAGEAGLLGLGELIQLARAVEEAATQIHNDRSTERIANLREALASLERALDTVQGAR